MSWWDTKQLASFATQALKTAQKRIDKVLDIKDEEPDENKQVDPAVAASSSSETVSSDSSIPKPEQNDFFESWLGDDMWSAVRMSTTTKQSSSLSSEELPRPTKGGRKKHISADREKASRTLTKLQSSAAEAEDSKTLKRNAKSEEEHLGEDTAKAYSGFTTSFISAFDQVRTSKHSEDRTVVAQSGMLVDDSSSTAPNLIGVAGSSEDAEEENLAASVKVLDSESPGKTVVNLQAPQETSMIADVASPETSTIADVAPQETSLIGDVAPQETSLIADTVSFHEEAVDNTLNNTEESNLSMLDQMSVSSLVDLKSSVCIGDAGWSDVSLSVISQEVASTVDESLTVDETLAPTFENDASVTLSGADDRPSNDELISDDLPLCHQADAHLEPLHHQMEPDDTEKLETPEMLLEIKQNTANSEIVPENDEAEKRDAPKNISISLTSSLSEIDTGLKEGISMEGSLAASDELSESNKTLTADDLDVSKDDTDIDESRQELSQSEEFGKSQTMALESDSIDTEADESMDEKKIIEDRDDLGNSDEFQNPETTDPTANVTEGLAELTVNTDGAEKPDSNKNDDSPRSIMSGSSYVRNLLEEAMAESGRDSNTDNSHESEAIRESEYPSGHTSADEIDTTTSSDIEIISHISTPSNNFRPLTIDTKPYDVSPSRAHAWSRSMRSASPHGHRRSDSGSSAQSLQSRNGEDLVSPEGGLYHHRVGGDDHMTDDRNWKSHGQRVHSRRCTATDVNKYNIPESCDQDVSGNPYDTDKLLKKLAEMATVLDAREKKQLELSQENVELLETNTILKNQLKQLEEVREAELEDVQEVTGEFTKRIADSEKKFQMVLREKDALKKTLQDLELGKRSENVMNEKLLKEKEQIIAELLEEGEKLSKQQLQSNNVVKKLRSKEKDNETTIRSQKQRVDEQKEEIERLESILEQKVNTEKKHVDTINQLNLALKTQEDEINRLKSELEDAVEKARSLKVALDNSYREISELHKARVTDVTEAQKVAINTEMQVKEQLKQKLEEHQLQSKHQQSALVTQIEDLQLSLCRMEKEHGRREDILRQEISDLHQHLQEAEERNQELTQGVSAATRPLLRQIENLQTTYSVQSSSYERVEKNLTDRLTESQSQLAMAVEKERLASDRLMEVTAKLTSLESQVSNLRQERVQLQSQLDMEHAKVELMQESKNNEAMQRDTAIHKLQLEVNDLKKDKVLFENQLEMEKMKVEAEKKKVTLVHEQLRDKEITIMQLTSSSNASAKHDAMLESLSLSSSTATMCSSSVGQQEDLDKVSQFAGSANRTSLYDSLRFSSTSSLIETLQSQLKLREGEISQLQSEINELERTRESMARQLVTLTLTNEDMEHKLSELTAIQQKYSELDGRYNALLQMYGEKVEEGEELRMDLQDVKEMYKSQIDELLKTKTISSNWNF